MHCISRRGVLFFLLFSTTTIDSSEERRLVSKKSRLLTILFFLMRVLFEFTKRIICFYFLSFVYGKNSINSCLG